MPSHVRFGGGGGAGGGLPPRYPGLAIFPHVVAKQRRDLAWDGRVVRVGAEEEAVRSARARTGAGGACER